MGAVTNCCESPSEPSPRPPPRNDPRQEVLKLQNEVFSTLKKYKQEHLIEHYKNIQEPTKKHSFLKQLKNIDYQQASQLYKHVYVERAAVKNLEGQEFRPVSNIATHEDLKVYSKEFQKIGFEAIGRGEVAVCIMSGGQGTRLGFNHPKGMFDLGLKCQLTLFGFFAHRLNKLNKLACQKSGKPFTTLIKWYLMTSEMNHQEIVDYFKDNDYFGYDKDAIVFFPQGGIPAFFYDGRIVVESEGQVSLAPGGNGAIYGEMKNKGVLEHMNKHNVKYIYLGPVDNVLLKLADPISLGYMVKNDFDIVSHYLRKRSAEEKVGLHMNANGKTKILEYSETDAKVKESKDLKGQFIFNHGARATMYIKRSFVEHLTNDPQVMLSINKKYHLAEKKVKYWSQQEKKTIAPEANNGVKFQLFYFDVFEETSKIGLFETIREEEFAPLKNAKGDDSPASAKEYLRKLHKKWLQDSGVEIIGEGDVQIHPGVSYNGEDLPKWALEHFGANRVRFSLFID